MKLLNASELSIAQKYQENQKQTHRKCCIPNVTILNKDRTLFNLEDSGKDEMNTTDIENSNLKYNSGSLETDTFGTLPTKNHLRKKNSIILLQMFLVHLMLLVVLQIFLMLQMLLFHQKMLMLQMFQKVQMVLLFL